MKRIILIALAAATQLPALTIRIDYSYDTSNFFNTQQKRNAIEAVAACYGQLIHDNLLRIDPAEFQSASWTATFFHPATGTSTGISNLIVPENTIIIYVGARVLSGSLLGQGGPGGFSASGFTPWFARIKGRGSPAAAIDPASARTDFSPWGGSIAFDSDRTWNFSQSQNLAGTEFVTVALHEMGHVLGIGLADSWKNRISNNLFTGPAAQRSNGSQPQVEADAGHFKSPVSGTLTSEAFGSFGMPHGTSRPVLMLASSTDNSVHLDVASDLDLAGLVDIGWQVVPTSGLSITSLGPGQASFTWRSSSFIDYRVQRSSTLESFPDGSPLTPGSGLIQAWSDLSPPAQKAFYRLAASPAFPPPVLAAAPAAAATTPNPDIMQLSEPPRSLNSCYAHHPTDR